MPKGKYQAVKSKAQERLLFAKANRGELPMHEARGKARAAKGKDLPEHVSKRKR